MSASPGEGVIRVLAIDPGTAATGYGVLQGTREETEVLGFGCIRPGARSAPEEKLRDIYRAVAELIRQHRPGLIALEDVFYHKNIRSTLKLGEVRGICLLAAAEALLPVETYSPRTVKKAVVGHGAADKTQVQTMVTALLGLKEAPEPLDASDALALALTCLQDKNSPGRGR